MNVKPYPPKASQIPRDTTSLTSHSTPWLKHGRLKIFKQNEAAGRDSEMTPGHVTGECRQHYVELLVTGVLTINFECSDATTQGTEAIHTQLGKGESGLEEE
jgi:hypothetical protein